MQTVKQVFKNTFAPNSANKEFTLSQIIGALKHGVLDFSDLPKNVQPVISVRYTGNFQQIYKI